MAKTSFREMGHRAAHAENEFVAIVARAGDISLDEAVKVFAYYRKIKVLKIDAYVGGTITVKHGALLDAETIRRAVIEAGK